MKLHAEINGEKCEVEIKRLGGELMAIVDGREYNLDMSEPEPGVFLFKHDGKIYEAIVAPSAKSGERIHVRIASSEFDVRLIDPKRLRGATANGDDADGLAEIKTAMPGKVVRILLEAGATVAKGDGVLVVEAMKMQNELKSPKDGIVKEVRTQEGATVSAGEVLATIE